MPIEWRHLLSKLISRFSAFFFPKSYDYDMPVIVSRQPLADVYKEENNLISFKSLFVFFLVLNIEQQERYM